LTDKDIGLGRMTTNYRISDAKSGRPARARTLKGARPLLKLDNRSMPWGCYQDRLWKNSLRSSFQSRILDVFYVDEIQRRLACKNSHCAAFVQAGIYVPFVEGCKVG
jgi:hypothetical protein